MAICNYLSAFSPSCFYTLCVLRCTQRYNSYEKATPDRAHCYGNRPLLLSPLSPANSAPIRIKRGVQAIRFLDGELSHTDLPVMEGCETELSG